MNKNLAPQGRMHMTDFRHFAAGDDGRLLAATAHDGCEPKMPLTC